MSQDRISAIPALLGLALFAVAATAADAWITLGAGSLEAYEILRRPRALMAALAGAVLAASGVTLQSVLRNDLASPFTLGVASGATLGAAIVIRFGLVVSLFGLPSIITASFLGAITTTALVYLTARRVGALSETLLLAGVGVALLVNAIVTTLFLVGDVPRYEVLLVWSLGNLQQVGNEGLRIAFPWVFLGSLGLLYVLRDLNAVALDDASAQALGVDTDRVRILALVATSFMTAGVVGVVGPIGFVGLIIPHATRRLVGPDARLVLPAAALLGAGFLPLCDLAARTVIYPNELPIGVITAVIGCPIFIGMLARR